MPGRIVVGHVKDPVRPGWEDVICDRRSVLGNPFDMGKDERLRDSVCDAFDRWLEANVRSQDPSIVVPVHAVSPNLKIADKWKKPTVGVVMSELHRLSGLHQQGKNLILRCWCKTRLRQETRCHCDRLAQVIQGHSQRSTR